MAGRKEGPPCLVCPPWALSRVPGLNLTSWVLAGEEPPPPPFKPASLPDLIGLECELLHGVAFAGPQRFPDTPWRCQIPVKVGFCEG